MTQDAILADTNSINNILKPFDKPDVAAVCGRQLPRQGAGVIESHARLFNYPGDSRLNSINDVPDLGIKAAFISNSFAAYRVSVLQEAGGFPDSVIFGEDMYIAARLLKAGYRIAYDSEACVYHSHDYSLIQEFRRYFDMGVFHTRESWIRRDFGVAESEGGRYVVSELKYLMRHAPWRIPESILRTLLKYTGYRLGCAESRIPMKLKKKISMNPGYFKLE
jgi:rhamnosyltransferase